LSEDRFFDGVQKINVCMEQFEKVLVGEEVESRLLKEPKEFLEDVLPKLSDEQRTSLGMMHEVRGDIMVGLGASKRALLEFSCAEALTAGDGVREKRARLEAALGQRQDDCKIPCTILTGFLGSGKTTLLNHILRAHHGKRIAVIENEFGEVGIDDSLVERAMETEENLVEMNNGCICCTVRGDLIAGLKKLVKTSLKNNKPLDSIIIETTGLADPAPVAQTFFADDYVQSKIRLDGILSMVDAKHLIQHLDEDKPEGVENEAVEQVAFADRILLNKCDLVDEDTLVEVERRIRMINASVPIQRTTNSEVEMDFIVGIKAFSLDKVLEMDDGFLDDDAEHQHDERVSSIGFDVVGEVDQLKLNEWISELLKTQGVNIFRHKGVLAVKGMQEKYVFQGIHMIFTGGPQRMWGPGEEKRCKMTFIGRDLDLHGISAGFMGCMAS